MKLTGSYRLAWSLQFDPDENVYRPSELWLTTTKAVTIGQRGRQITKGAAKDPPKELSDSDHIAPGGNLAKRRKTSGIDASTALRPMLSCSQLLQSEDEHGASDAHDTLSAATLGAAGEEVDKDGAMGPDDVGDGLESENIIGAEPLAKRQKTCDDCVSALNSDEGIFFA